MTNCAQTWDWAIKLGGADFDQSKRIATDDFGNVYLVGTFKTDSLIVGSDTLFNKGTNDILIVKADSLGNIKWARSAGGTSSDFGNAITTDSQGNVYFTGYFFSSSVDFDTISVASIVPNQMFTAKYDSTGNALWVKCPTGNANSTSWGITTDQSDNILVTGEYEFNPITFGSITLPSMGLDMFVVKYDINGNAIWGNCGAQIGVGVATDQSNNVFVVGYFNGDKPIGSYTLINNSLTGYSDVYIAKYDSTGNLLWAKSAGSTGLDQAYSVATDNSGNAYFTGSYGEAYSSSITFGTTTLNNQGQNDVFIAKYDVAGNVVWAKSIGGTDDDYGNCVAADNLGNVFITGYFYSPSMNFGSMTLTNSGTTTREMFILKYNLAGTELFADRMGNTMHDEGMDISIDNQNNIFFTGTFRSDTITLGAYELTNTSPGEFDICLGKLSSFSTGISVTDIPHSSTIYPNPFVIQTTFQTSTYLHNATITIENCFGQKVKEIKNISGQTVLLTRENLASGLYFLHLTQNNKIILTNKLIITD